MAWIESHQTLAGHPKTRKLAHLLNISKPAAIGHLHMFWWWSLDYSDDGMLDDFDAIDIAIGAEWEGDPDAFVSAMVRVGFLDQDENETLSVHDWDDYGGKLTRARKAHAERMKKARAEKAKAENASRDTHVPGTDAARDEPQYSTEENRTEKDRNDGADAPKSKRATQVPPDFAVTDGLRKWAADPKNQFTEEQMESQVPQFIDHWTAKGEARKDWEASFRTWMRNAKSYGHLNKSAGTLTDHKGGRYGEAPVERPDLIGPARMEWARQKWINENPEEARQRGMA